MNRRDLVRRIALGGAVFMVSPALFNSCSKDSSGDTTGGTKTPPGSSIKLDITLPAYAALASAGGSVVVSNILVANTGSTYIAVSAICTHQGCTVGYDNAAGNLKCPCHGSVFSTTGSVVNGPATSALESYQISKSGNILTITT